MQGNRPVSGGSSRSVRNNDKLLDHLRSMQQMEKDTQETLGKFMSVLSTHQATDYAGLLEEKIAELKQADEEVEGLRNEIINYQERVKELTSVQQATLAEKGRIIEEKLRAGKAATQADTIIKNLQSQMRVMEQKHSENLQTKDNILKRLEEENTHSKSLVEEAQAKVESCSLEASELQSAMASLHAEIAAQQRELDESKERDTRNIRQKKELNVRLDEKETELSRARNERRNAECRITDLEKKLADQELGVSQMKEEGRSEVDKLTRDRENVQGSLAKMSLKLKQQTDTNRELNSLVQRMRHELSQAQESASSEHTRAEDLQREAESLQILVKSLESNKIESAALTNKVEKDKAELTQELAQASDRVAALLSEQRKSTAAIEKLERQRTELTVDLSCRAKDSEGDKRVLESQKIEIEELRGRQENERIAKERALEKLGTAEADLERAKADLRENIENVESQARQLRESERMREQAMETSRVQQRENANRIIEFSQKNAKLSSELSSKNDEVFALKRGRDESRAAQQEAQKERDDLKSQYTATRVRLQTVEDEHEEALAKYESSRSEVEELRQELKNEIISRERTIASLNEKHEEAINVMSARLEGEAEDKAAIAEAARKGAEEKLSRTMSKEKDKHKQEIEELQVQRQHDAEVQKARLATLAKAMEDLQVELREETNKNSTMTQELSVLKELAEVGSAEAQERVQYVERDRARERSRLEGQLQDLKEQLRQHAEQKMQRDQLMATIEQQLSRERESKFNALQKLRAAEDEVGSLTQQVDMLQEEVQTGRKDVRGSERKLAIALQAKDAELARLTRRNEVLGEAVTRLTNSSQKDEAATNAAVAKYLNVPSSRPDSSSHPETGENGELECDEHNIAGDSDGRTHGMMTRAMTAPSGNAGNDATHELVSNSPRTNQLDLQLTVDPIMEDSSKQRANTAPLVSSLDEDNGALFDKSTITSLQEPRRDTLFTSEENHDMESLFHSSQSSPVDMEGLAVGSLEEEGANEATTPDAAEDQSMTTPRSPSDRPDASKQSDSTDSTKSEGSNSSFTEKLRKEVVQTKGQELPFSPNKAKRVPVMENPKILCAPPAKTNSLLSDPNVKENQRASKHNIEQPVRTANSSQAGPAKPRIKPQDRIGRARRFLQEKRHK